jgi:hypothetical protein
LAQAFWLILRYWFSDARLVDAGKIKFKPLPNGGGGSL